MNSRVMLVLGAVAANLCAFAYLRRLWRQRRIVRKRVKYSVAVAILAGIVAAVLSTTLMESSETLRVYGFPLPVLAWERNKMGEWWDYASPFSPVFALGNFGFWIALCMPLVILIVRSRHVDAG